jgi:hypothetical protein
MDGQPAALRDQVWSRLERMLVCLGLSFKFNGLKLLTKTPGLIWRYTTRR